jgi:hypothetical protein
LAGAVSGYFKYVPERFKTSYKQRQARKKNEKPCDDGMRF